MAIIMGVDPAGMGSDKAVISILDIEWERGEARQLALEVFPKTTLGRKGGFEGIIRERFIKYHPLIISIDAVGIGAGIVDNLKEDNYPVVRIFGGGSAIEKNIYHNRRSELYARLRDWLDPGKPGRIKLIKNDNLRIQLTQMGPMFQTVKGKIRAPSKEEFKKKNNRSPDELDATVYCFVKEEEWEERPGILEVSLGSPSQYPKNEWVTVNGEDEDLEDEDYGHFPGSDNIPIVDL